MDLHGAPTLERIEAISWDCAGTLIDALWQPGVFAVECAKASGIQFEDERHAAQIYVETLQLRWSKFRKANETGSFEATERFWLDLTRDWLVILQLPFENAAELVELANSRLYAPDSPVFIVYDDVLPTLDALRERGIRMIVISNWDISLFRILEAKSLSKYFEFAIASLVFGMEKPHESIFLHGADRLEIEPSRILHIGDSYPDDVLGARAVGMQALHLDRGRSESSQGTINTLLDVPRLLLKGQ